MLNNFIILKNKSYILLLFLVFWTHSSFHNSPIEKNESFSKKSYSEEDEIWLGIVDDFIQIRLDKYNCAGMAMAIVKGDEVYYQKSYGYKNVKTKEAINNCTVFRIGSVSKGFAGVLTSILAEKGLIDINYPISYYVPNIPLRSSSEDTPITVRNILSHTTGYRVHTYSDLIDNNYERNEIYKKLTQLRPNYKTGSDFAYQNAIFGIIEAVIESATGIPYSEALQKYIFDPLDMNETSYAYEDLVKTNNYCVGHKLAGNSSQLSIVPLGKHYYNMVSAGGINAPVEDMTKWLKACMGHNKDVLSDVVRRNAFTPNIKTTYDRKYFNNWPTLINSYYGLGWRNIETETNYLVHHGGLVNGFRTEIAFDAQKQIGVVFMFNSTCQLANEVVHDFYVLWNEYFENKSTRNLSGI